MVRAWVACCVRTVYTVLYLYHLSISLPHSPPGLVGNGLVGILPNLPQQTSKKVHDTRVDDYSPKQKDQQGRRYAIGESHMVPCTLA